MFEKGFPREWSTLRKLMWLLAGGNPPVPPASNKVGTAKVGTAKCE